MALASIATLTLALAVPAAPAAGDAEPACTPPQPRVTHSPAAPYPHRMLRQQHAGVVRFQFQVHPDGRISDVVIVESAGKELDGATLRTVLTWRAEPYPATWCQVPVRLGSRMTFALE